jgi:hypothetical protein
MCGKPVNRYCRVLTQRPFPFHRTSHFFKLNLFPIAFQGINKRVWGKDYSTCSGFQTPDGYLEWCRNFRFPRMRAWAKRWRPKLIIGAGSTFKADFKRAFGFEAARETKEDINGAKLVWMSRDATVLAVIPSLARPGRGLLSNPADFQACGKRLRALLDDLNQGKLS